MLAVIPFPDIGPEIFSVDIGGFTLALRWYAMAYIVGILIGWRISIAATSKATLWPGDTPPLTRGGIEDLLTWIILGVILGGRLGYVLFYQPGYYIANPAEALMIWQGGMSFHGGMLGVATAVIVFSWRQNAPVLSVGDMMALVTAPGLFLGRMANFINAELWGRATDVPWAVVFPGAAAQDCPDVTGLCARHPSQLYEALLEGIVLGVLILWLAYRRGWLKTPGALGGVFLAGYGTARFLVELVRQPDAQFVTDTNPVGYFLQFGPLGLTMGQLLSLPMIALGLFLILRARQRA